MPLVDLPAYAVLDPPKLTDLPAGAQLDLNRSYTSSMLPFRYDQQGKRSFDPTVGLPANIAKQAWDAFNLSGDVAEQSLTGRTPQGVAPLMDPATGRPSASMFDRTANLALMTNLTSPANIANRPSLLPAPSAAQLKEAGGAGFDAARGTGLEVAPAAVGNAAGGFRQFLESEGRVPLIAPKTHALLDFVETKTPGDIGALQAVRSRFLDIAMGPDKTDAAAAAMAVKRLDGLLENLSPGNTVGGTATGAEVSDILKTARGNYAAGQRANALSGELDRATTGIVERADAQAAASNSGRNFDNALRQRVNAFLREPNNLLGFSDAEIAILQQVRDGTATQNQLRSTANLFGGGGGLGRLATIYGGITGGGLLAGADPLTAGGIAGVALPAIGGISKVLENALARRSIAEAEQAIRQRSPLFERRMEFQNPATELTARDAAVLRGLLPGLLAPPTRERRPTDQGFI